MAIYRVVNPFATGNVVVNDDPSVVYTADHPLVRSHPANFVEVTILGAGGKAVRDVEQATAAPGEKRTVKR